MALKCLPRRQSPRRADATASGPADGCLGPRVATEVIYSVSEVEEKEEKLLDWNRVRENMAEQGDTSPALESK